MSLRVWSLASGSSGNAFLIQGGRTAVLLDAGFSARVMKERIAGTGVDPAAVEALFLTHEHSDHASGAGVTSRALRAPLIANEATLAAAGRTVGAVESVVMPTGSNLCLGDLTVRSFAVSHDAAEPVGYVFSHGRHSVCYATDTGCLTPEIENAMRDASLVVLESNHDVLRLARCDYAEYLKQRILGDRGHLSNHAAGDALINRSLTGDPAVVWLAHLSRENNSPRLAMKSAMSALREGRAENLRLAVAKRDVPSLHWDAGVNWWQRSLF
jgi:phosphoribosyl 1,2-cyclic phosphodiesterase